jgi:hypothetical protein
VCDPTVPTSLEPGRHALVNVIAAAVIAEACFVREVADRAMRNAAISEHCSDDEVEVDDKPCISASDQGTWVQAWVYVPNPEKDDEDDNTDGDSASVTSPTALSTNT